MKCCLDQLSDRISVRKDNKIHRFYMYLFLILCYVFLGMLLYDKLHNFSQPRLVLHKDYIKTDLFDKDTGEDLVVYGRYSPAYNNIDIAAISGSREKTFYHEYGHWIFYKRMSDKERKYFVQTYCNQCYEKEGYAESEQCEEQFADAFARVVYGLKWITNDTTYVDSYAREMFLKYVPE